MMRRLSVWGLALVIGAVALSQTSLDRNLRQGSGGRNYTQESARSSMAAPIYTANRNTGEMVYNRANAFRDPSYQIYQSWSYQKFDALNPSPRTPDASARQFNKRNTARGSTGSIGSVSQSSRSLGRGRALARSSGAGAARYSSRRATAGSGRASSLRAPTYTASRAQSGRYHSGRVRR